jgi:LemA protein
VSGLQIGWLAAAAVLAFWAIGARNRLMSLRNAIGAAWLQIDALLKRRYALVETLLLELRPSFVHESRTLDALLAAAVQLGACADAVRARPSAAAAASSLALAEGVFGQAMSRVLALLDTPPADGTDVHPTIAELVDLETRLGFSRQAFNDAVGAFNAALAQFPTRLLSRLFGLRAAGRL